MEETDDQTNLPLNGGEGGADLDTGEHDADPFGSLGSNDAVNPGQPALQHSAVQKQQSRQCLIRRAGR
jgi:hypothetical protein